MRDHLEEEEKSVEQRQQDVQDRIRDFWDEDAEVYDRSPSHSASQPGEAAAWRAALLRHLPPPGASVLDVGAGTGSLALLAAELGYEVTALDLSSKMLDRAKKKAEQRGVELRTVTGSAAEPPEGPFDAVIERHVMWTLQDPPAALRAWRAVAPAGRIVLYEGLYGSTPWRRAVSELTNVLRKALAVPHDHHASYDEDLHASLPLRGKIRPDTLIELLGETGYARARVERLRDVEWTRRLSAHPLLGWLESSPVFAVLAEP